MGSALGTTASEAPRRPHPLALRTLVDLARFAGEWYLVASTVHAQPLRDVRFTYRLEAVAGGTPTLLIVEQGFALDSDKYAEWRALAVPFNQYNSLLAVTALNGPSPTTRVASADYHILAYDFSRNRWALVSTDNGRTVCFLSRATTLDTQAHSALATEAEDVHGYDMSQLVYTQHTPRVCIPDAFPALGPAPPIQQQSVAPPPYTHTDTTTGTDTAGAPSTISGATARNRRNGNGGARRVRIAAAV
jgi:lipocalin